MRVHTMAAGLGLALIAGSARANHVDFVVDGIFNISGPGSTVVSGDPANILGGARFVGIDTVDGASSADLMIGNEFINFDNDDTAAGVLTLDYGDFLGGNGQLNSDFASTWNFVAVEFLDVVGDGSVSISFESTAGAGASASQVVNAAGIYYFAFDDAGFASVDFGDIDRVTVQVFSSLGSDFDIGAITREVVPAPASLALLGLGGLAAGRRRRG